MPKIKTHSGMKKRFKPTGAGNIKHRRAFRSHLLVNKPASRRRPLRHMTLLKTCDMGAIRRHLHLKTRPKVLVDWADWMVLEPGMLPLEENKDGAS